MKVIASYFLIALFIFGLTACGARADETTPEMAQSLLKVRGFNFTEDEFFKAIKQNDSAAVKLFLQGGIDPNTKNKTGETALTYAAVNSSVPVLKVLMEKADVNQRDGLGNSPIFIALKKEKIENFQYILDGGADPNGAGTAGNVTNQSVLYVAVLQNKTENVKKLLDKGANPDLADSDGSIPLSEQVLARTPNMEVFKMLLEKGKNVNIADRTGSTVLHYIAKNDRMPREYLQKIIKDLLAKGADKTLKDKDGKTPLDWAKTKNNKEAIELLK